MKNLSLILLGALLVVATAAITRQTTGIYIANSTDEVHLKIRKTGETNTAPFLEVVDGDGTLKFTIPVTVGTATITNVVADVATNQLIFVKGLLISSTAL